MARVLVAYGSSEGQTEKIARHLADKLEGLGHSVTMVGGDALSRVEDVRAYDGVLVGASVHTGHYQDQVVGFVERHRGALAGMPTAFVSVSLTATRQDEDPEAREDLEAYVEEFGEQTGWHPVVVAHLAGALWYTEFGGVYRWIMKRVAAGKGMVTDTSRDWEYTDWEEVDEFAAAFAGMLEAWETEEGGA